MPWIAALALVSWLGGVSTRSPDIDAAAVQDALEIRAGKRAHRWTIELESGPGGEVRARLRDGRGHELRRTYVLVGTTDEERSRELAAALALVLESEASDPEPEEKSKPSATSSSTAASDAAPATGWIAVGPRFAVGAPRSLEGGVSLRGGALWGRRILQPLASVSSLHGRSGPLMLDGVRVGVGLAAGSPWRQWWFGGSLIPTLVWAHARDRRDAAAVGSITELTGLVQWRGPRGLLLGARAGLDLAAPALRARGRGDTLRVPVVRLAAGVEVGLVLGPTKQR